MQPGDIISERYRLLRLLDVGGMGEVWAAKNELTQKNFAIKFLLPELAERPDVLERFVREAETAGRLEHPSIVDVFDVAQAEDGRLYIVMELLAGESLEARIDRQGPMPPIDAAGALSQIADALDVAHRAGVIHRDLSAANIFLTRTPDGGRPLPKILDFGVSKTLGPEYADRAQTSNGAVLGCPESMSPEQARGAEAVDQRTDVWSLGVLLYQALAGAPPFREKNYNALMVAILTRPHRPILEVVPSLDPELATLVESCLSKDRETRTQTAREVAEKLSQITRRLSGDAPGPTPRRRATDRLPGITASDGRFDPKTGRRSRKVVAWVGLASALAGFLLGAVCAFWVASHSASSVPSWLPVSRPTARGSEPARLNGSSAEGAVKNSGLVLNDSRTTKPGFR